MLSGDPIVSEFMDKSFVRLRPEMEIFEAIDILLKKRLTGTAVVAAADRLGGVVWARDRKRPIHPPAYNHEPMGRVKDYMSVEVRTVNPHTDIFEVAEFFQNNIFRRLLVVEDQRLVGQITRRDVLHAIQTVQRSRRS